MFISLYVIFFSLSGLHIAAGNDPIISVAPVDTVGCYGAISAFYCVSDRSDVGTIGWQINGDSIADNVTQSRGISVHTNGVGNSTLTIIGSDFNNGISIGCVVITLSPLYIDIHTALFTVSDIPPVTNLTITFTNNGIMSCTWIQPSCLPVNYQYIISINNVPVPNTTSTVYQYHIEPCTDYTVSVTVTNTRYQSKPAIKAATSGYYKDLAVDLQARLVYFTKDLHCFAMIQFQVLSLKYRNSLLKLLNNCQEKLFNKVEVSLEYSQLSKVTNNNLIFYDESTGIGMYSIGPLNGSFVGHYILQTQDGKEIGRTKLSTFHVQHASIAQLFNGDARMKCSFASNSPAGCRFEIVSRITGSQVIQIDITKEVNEWAATHHDNLDIPEGNYDVHVHDIVNGEVEAMPAFKLSYNQSRLPHNNAATTTTASTTKDHSSGMKQHGTSGTTIASSSNNEAVDSSSFSIIVGASVLSGIDISLLILIIVLTIAAIVWRVRSRRSKKTN